MKQRKAVLAPGGRIDSEMIYRMNGEERKTGGQTEVSDTQYNRGKKFVCITWY